MAEAESLDKPVEKRASARMLSEVGQPGLVTSNSFVKELSKKELVAPKVWNTFDQMCECSAVSEPLALKRAILINALAEGVFEGTGSRLSEALADYGNYIIHNMENMNWDEAVSNICTHIKYGFSMNEIVAKRATSGKYKGDLVLSSLGPRSPKSIYAFVWDKYKRNVTHIVQNPLQEAEFNLQRSGSYLGDYISNSVSNLRSHFNKFPVISLQKLVYSVYDSTLSNPLGNSPLVAAYIPYQELKIVSEYEIIGMARNFGGTPVAKVPDQLLIDAANPECPEYESARQEVAKIQDDLENAHAGRQTHFILPSGLVDGSSTVAAWDLKLLGIDGSSGSFDVNSLINRKISDIYRAFNCSHLNLGQNGNSGSYSLAENGANSHTHVLKRDLNALVGNVQKLLATMLEAQGFSLDKRDLPKFRAKTPDQLSLDELGKFIQRAMSVGGMTLEMMETLCRWANIGTEGLDKIDFDSRGVSGAGKGFGTSGTGVKDQGNSATNMENKQKTVTEQRQPEHYVEDDLGDQKAILDQDGKLVTIIEKSL